MNDLSTLTESGHVITAQDVSLNGLLFDMAKFQAMQAMSKAMSEAAIAVPAHFRGKPGDCLAVVMQAAQWGMNPFAVAQKTHVVNGALGYEAQLVNAVVQSSGAIVGRFHYEYRGEGAALECRVGAMVRGESEITWGEWLKSSDVTTKNSPLWKVNPRQQMGYLQVKNWARAYTPGAILGIYSDDELADYPRIKDITAEGETLPRTPAPASRTEAVKARIAKPKGLDLDEVLSEIAAAPDEAALKRCADLAGKLTGDVEKEQARNAYSARKAELKAAAKAVDAASAPSEAMTYAQVAEALNTAGDVETLDVKADLIREVADEVQREELTALYRELRETLGA